MKPVQGVADGLIQVAQIIRQHKDEPKLLRRLQMQIGQDVERKLQLLMQATRIPFEFRGERYDPRSQRPRLGIDFLQSLQLRIAVRSPMASEEADH